MQQHINKVLDYLENIEEGLFKEEESNYYNGGGKRKGKNKDYYVYRKVAECGVEDFCFLFRAYDAEGVSNSMEKLLISYYNPPLNTLYRTRNKKNHFGNSAENERKNIIKVFR
jgi:hypothetical protein